MSASPHFAASEFDCRCNCGFGIVNPELLYFLEAIREKFDRPVTILSGCRCKKHNKYVGGKSRSRHLTGEAADIVVKDIPPSEVADYCSTLLRDRGGLGRYKSFTHIDVRGHRARWKGVG